MNIKIEDQAIACGYIPIHKALSENEFAVDQTRVKDIEIILTNTGKLLYVTDWYGGTDYALIPKVCRNLVNVCKDNAYASLFRSALKDREVYMFRSKESIVWEALYSILGIQPGDLKKEYERELEQRRKERSEPDADKGVYFVKADNGLTKIGCTSDFAVRFNALKLGSPCDLKLELFIECRNYYEVEAFLHDTFNNRWKHGEWFALTESDYDKVLDMGLSVSTMVYAKYKVGLS